MGLKLSSVLYNVSWDKVTPLTHPSKIEVKIITFDQFACFLSKQLVPHKNLSPREKYYQECVDLFGFFDGPNMCGVFSGNPVDWETYYIRYCRIDREYQRRGLATWFYKWIISQVEQAGVTKIQTETSPNNAASIRIFSNLNFVVTGSAISDTFGSLLKFTKFCSAQDEASFVEKFCFP